MHREQGLQDTAEHGSLQMIKIVGGDAHRLTPNSRRRSTASAWLQSPRYSTLGMISDGNFLAVLALVDAVQMNGSFCCSASNLYSTESELNACSLQCLGKPGQHIPQLAGCKEVGQGQHPSL